MKNKFLYILFIALITQCIKVNGQLVIGEINDTPGVILDFNRDVRNTRGIILPIVDNLPVGLHAENGTFLFDSSDMKVKVKENSQWVMLTSNSGDLTLHQPSLGNEVGGGIYVGDEIVENSPKGILVLNSVNKALILPHVYRPQENVKSPYPGMICYDTDSKSLFVFNGKYWSVWRKSTNDK